MDELQLIEGCKDGKREFQKVLYEKYSRMMYGICLRYLSSAEAAQDILHDGFIKVFAVIKSYSGTGSFEGWLKRVFVNLALEQIRKDNKNAEHTTDLENVSDMIDESDQEPPDISEDVLMQMIQDLPQGYRTVFNLYAIDHLSHKEIAGMLGIAEGTSRSQYIRGRQILQERVLNYRKNNS